VTDTLMVQRAQRGDATAYEELVRRYQTVAFRTAWLILTDPDDARDAVQTAFLKAWLAIRQVDASRPFQPWLLTIVANEARNRRRARGRWLARLAPAKTIDLLVESAPLPELEAVRRDEAATVLRHLAAMAEADRLTLWCRYVLELGEQETADILGCAVGTVKSRSHRALERLRAHLREAELRAKPTGGDGHG
jgi:RNA polymerase sigma factor (sigma-70 family)